ncbi:MAG TPA: GDSL-type esterase/lipase family protein, partial [bacterium]
MNRFINLQRSISIGIAVLLLFVLTAFASAQIKIMPLGDSITRGVENLTPTDDDNGYRDDLATLLDAAGVTYDFVGRLTNPVSGATFDANHEGHNGQRADQVLGQINTILNTNVPDVVLLHVGTNDISNADANSSTILEISQIVDAIKNKNANTKIILASLVPRIDSPTFDDNTSALNALIEDLVQSKRGAGVKIWYAGMNEIFKANANFAAEYFTAPDGVHPNDAGYGIMAQVYLNEILIAENGSDVAVSDNFERSTLGITWDSDPENVLQSGDLINNATSGSGGRWNYMSTYRNQKNPNRVSLKWAATANATAIEHGGLALLLNDPTRTADGYLAYITPSDNKLQLWTISNGNSDQDLLPVSPTSLTSAPGPGDVFRVDVSVGANLQFDYFVNDVAAGSIQQGNPGLGSNLYSGIILDHSQDNDVGEFAVVKFSDTAAPDAITNLATGNVTATAVALSWTATGDDGIDGQAASYDLRYSTSNITSGNFNSATQVTSVPAPGASGAPQAFTVGSLLSGTTYFFAIKAKDEAGNAGPISNVVSAATSEGNIVEDNFDRATLGANWTADAGYQTLNNQLNNGSSSENWDELAIYNARKNPVEVQFTWAADAGATGIDQAGFAIVTGSASPTSSGYAISRRNPNQQLRLWNIVNGSVTTTLDIFGDGGGEVLEETPPVAGDVVRIVISVDPDGNHFDFYKNDLFDARVTDPAFTYDLTQDYWAGLALRANNPGGVAINNDIDNFQLLLQAGAPSQLVLVSGDLQSAPAEQQLLDPLVVKLTDDSGNPIAGANINYIVTAGGGTLDVAPPSENVVIEGEVGSLTAPMVIGNDGLASNGKFIHVPDGQGGASTGKATYSFNIDVAGNYIMWGRAITPDVNGDVFNIKMDNGQEYLWDVGQRQQYGQPWFWDEVSHRGTGSATNPQLNPVV